MNSFVIFILIGFGAGIIIFPICLWIFLKIKDAKERRRIKRMIKQGKILTPIDPKDYNVEAWKNQKYGNIDIDAQKETLDSLNQKIFKRFKIDEEKPMEEKLPEKRQEVSEVFIARAKDYLLKARDLGYTDSQIIEEFKKKSYSEELIAKIFEYGNPKSTN